MTLENPWQKSTMSKRRGKPQIRKAVRDVVQPAETADNISHQVTVHQQSAFSGPIPPPEALAQYDQIVPGSADRIIQMAENETKHRHSLENTALNATVNETRRGQRYGMAIGIVVLITSIIALFLGYETAASVLGGGTLVSLVSVFVYGRSASSKARRTESQQS